MPVSVDSCKTLRRDFDKAHLENQAQTSLGRSKSRQRLYEIELEPRFNQCPFNTFIFCTRVSYVHLIHSVFPNSHINTMDENKRVRQQLKERRPTCNMQSGYTQHNIAQVEVSISQAEPEWEADWQTLVGYKRDKIHGC